MIEVRGFTQEQSFIANILWNLESQDEITTFIQSLPETSKTDAIIVREMIVATYLDQCTDIEISKHILLKYGK